MDGGEVEEPALRPYGICIRGVECPELRPALLFKRLLTTGEVL
jgi:hypothetical protein